MVKHHLSSKHTDRDGKSDLIFRGYAIVAFR